MKGRKEERQSGRKQEAEWLCKIRRSQGVEQKEDLEQYAQCDFISRLCGVSISAEEKSLPWNLSNVA